MCEYVEPVHKCLQVVFIMAQTGHSDLAVFILLWQSSIRPAWTHLVFSKWHCFCEKESQYETSVTVFLRNIQTPGQIRAVVPAGWALGARHHLHYGSRECSCELLLMWSASVGWGHSSALWEMFSWDLEDRKTHVYIYTLVCILTDAFLLCEMTDSLLCNQCSCLHWLCNGSYLTCIICV